MALCVHETDHSAEMKRAESRRASYQAVRDRLLAASARHEFTIKIALC